MVSEEKRGALRAFLERNDIGERGTPNRQAIRYHPDEDDKEYTDIRPPFFRDVDRIVHSKSYARYIDKTQVFFAVDNANITHRSLHVVLVSRVSRQIGRILGLNTDLIEAVALGHDLGHAPYGHVGEEILDRIGRRHGLGRFAHSAQSVRWLAYLEKRFPDRPASGLNLTLQVLDGILCHDGEVDERELKPKLARGKSWQDHFGEYEDCFGKGEISRVPMTYEGIAVRFADDIAYMGKDIEDAILLGIIDRSDIPEECQRVLGNTNRGIMNNLIMDLLSYSIENETIGYSEEVFEAYRRLRAFNYERIYLRRDYFGGKSASRDIGMRLLFTEFECLWDASMKGLEEEDYSAPVFRDHVSYIDDGEYDTYFGPLRDKGLLALIARDYLAGMSDRYFRQACRIGI